MGIIENLGAVASSYMDEKKDSSLQRKSVSELAQVTVSGHTKCSVTR